MKKQVILLGDMHCGGKFEYLKTLINKYQIGNNEDITYIIQVGDFGIGFYPKSDELNLRKLNKFLKLHNIVMLVIRGNHDNPSYFNGDYVYPNLKLLPDYTTMSIHGKKYLFVGGAISIDRKSRLATDQLNASMGFHTENFWFDEVFIYDPKKLEGLDDVEVVITHSAPEWCEPNNKLGFGDLVNRFADTDEHLLDDLRKERKDISMMFHHLENNGCNIELHAYGHFHRSHSEVFKNTQHWLIGIYEFKEIPNYD